jgi:hypothetical protein
LSDVELLRAVPILISGRVVGRKLVLLATVVRREDLMEVLRVWKMVLSESKSCLERRGRS